MASRVALSAASAACRAACLACSAAPPGRGVGQHVDLDRLGRDAQVPRDDLPRHDLGLIEAPHLRGQPLDLRNVIVHQRPARSQSAV